MEAFQKRTNSVRGEVQDFFGAFNVPIGRLGAGAALGYIAFQSIKAADALAGVEARAGAVFEESFPRVSAEAEKMSQKLQRSQSDLLDMQTGFGGVLKEQV